jgi:glycerophosphoryl diester phosphodiesterase
VPLAIAHRGDPEAWRENTLASFASAVRQGADMVEIDLRRTADDEIVVLHDPTLERLWGVPAAVDQLDLAQVQAAGQGPVEGEHRIPTFAQVLAQVTVPLMVDFTRRDVVEGALRQAAEAGALERCLFVTGNVEALRLLRGLSAEARLGLTWVEPGPLPADLLTELGAEYWNPMFKLATPAHVAAVHALGLGVSTWTVDARRHMARLRDTGVDAIVSNRIADLVRFLAA